MKTSLEWCGRLFAAGVLALLPALAGAYSFRMMSDADLLAQAEGVAVLRVLEARPAADGELETRYRVEPLRSLAGPKLDAEHWLALPGTFSAPNRNFHVPGVPRLLPGGVAMVFYRRRADGVLQPVQLALGLFGLTADGAHYVRNLEGASEFGKRAAQRRYHAPRAAPEFERWLADRARGLQREPDYLRDGIVLDARAKYTLLFFNGLAGRWFEFDAGQSMPWRADAGGQAGAAADEFASVQQALAAWTDDFNSRILLGYAGTLDTASACGNPPGGAAAPFAGFVCWNDPNAIIAGSYDCGTGGTLAVGGSFLFGQPQPFGNAQWNQRAIGYVIVQDGTACFFDRHGGADGAEVLTHEVGHALGFGHACGDDASPDCGTDPVLAQATMRAFAHGDGRGAMLGDDDRAVAAHVYPRPGGLDTTPPGVPAGLAATADHTTITLAWPAASDGLSGVAGYRIERCRGAACGDFVQVGASTAPAYIDGGLQPQTPYRYRVAAVDVAGNVGGFSGIAEATTGDALILPLADGVAVNALAGAQDSQRLFSIEVPEDATQLRVQLTGNGGDADLYVRFGAPPSQALFACRSWEMGSNESCSLDSPAAGTYYVLVHGYEAYAGLRLVADYDAPLPCVGDCAFRDGFE